MSSVLVRALVAVAGLAGGLCAGEAPPSAPATGGQRPGVIKAFTATGGALWRGADGKTVPLARDTLLTGAGTLECGAGGSAFVVFSNGSLLLLLPGAELAVTHFTQAPYDESRAYLSLARNPSRSDLALDLRAGEMLISVLGDAAAAVSTFTLGTPAGAITTPAGSLRVALAPGADAGETIVTVQCLKGTLAFRPVLPAGVPARVGPLPVTLEGGGGVLARLRRDAHGRVVALNLLGLAGPRGEIQRHTYRMSVALSKALNPAASDGPYQQPYVPEPVAPRDLPLAPAGPDTYHPAGTVVPP